MLGNFIGITFIVLFLQVGSLHCLLVRVHVRVHVRKRIPAVSQCVCTVIPVLPDTSVNIVLARMTRAQVYFSIARERVDHAHSQ